MLKKLNFVLCILIVLVFLFQMFLMFQDYFTYIQHPTLKEKKLEGKTDRPVNASIMQFVWTNWTDQNDMPEYLVEKLTEAKELDPTNFDKSILEQFEANTNKYVLGLVGIMVFGAVVAVMTIFTRKSLVQYLFTLAWAAVGVYACFADNYVLQHMGATPNAGKILMGLKIASIVAAVLTVARAYPWFYTRWIHKEKLDLEALNA